MSDQRSIEMEEHTAAVEEEEEDSIDEEEYEDDDDGDEDMDDYEEAEESSPSETTSPPISSPIAGDGEKMEETNRGEIDVCPICFQLWTSAGDHRICCLPCGHIYGMSCITKWLIRCQGDGKCPQCKSLCTVMDIRLLYATRLCVADEKPHEACPTNFSFTKEGFGGFQQYVTSCVDAFQQRLDALNMRTEELGSQVHILRQRFNELTGQTQENTQ
ncbi:uncharacterized protein LOC143560426 [Bidens hawaiensis]|uniref:uncharacterized protein LOC143560426 n=1 Tax=Bidens hawaiensis TaxID=980011 RepID=UPI00404B2FF9